MDGNGNVPGLKKKPVYKELLLQGQPISTNQRLFKFFVPQNFFNNTPPPSFKTSNNTTMRITFG
ncbi:hypothetical protein BGZ93_004047, partial [Podila epicladia]